MTMEDARARLTVLRADTIGACGREGRRLTERDNEALTIVLDELHRLRVAVSTQRAELEKKARKP